MTIWVLQKTTKYLSIPPRTEYRYFVSEKAVLQYLLTLFPQHDGLGMTLRSHAMACGYSWCDVVVKEEEQKEE